MIRLRALGECVFEVGANHVTPDSDVLFALLLVLARNAGQPVTRAELLELLWPDSDTSSARHRLRQAVYQLKKLGAPLDTPATSINLRTADVEVDYVTCRSDRQRLADSVSEVRRLEVLPHYAPTFSEPFARWVESERDRVRATLRRLLLEAIAEKRAKSAHGEVVSLARACLDLDPLSVEATAALAEALAMRGNRADALAVLDQYLEEQQRSREKPSRTLVELQRRIVESSRQTTLDFERHPPLVGRGEIVRELEEWLSGAASHPRVLAFVGDAGIGKTRLMLEGVRIARLHGRLCVEYRSSANGEERPLAGLLDLLPLLLALPGAVGCAPESYRRLTALAEGLDTEWSIPEDRTDSAFRFATIRRGVLDLFEAVLSECEILLAVDDAHGLDRPTLEILLDTARSNNDGRMLLMLGLRPSGPSASLVASCNDVRRIRVGRLNDVDAREIVARGLPESVAIGRTKVIDWAVELAAGNPFFLVELSAHCRGDHSETLLPDSLQVALKRRIDALSLAAQLVLQACAALGRNSSLARLELMLGLPPHAMASALSELESGGLIAARDGWVGCRHDLIAEVVTNAMRVPVGTYLHRRCAVVLDGELQSSNGAISVAWDCARHWDAAEEPTRALRLTILIVDQLLSLGLPSEAAHLCDRAERYCRTPDEQAERLLRLSRARRLLYDWEGVVTALEQRRALLAGMGHRSDRFSEDETSLVEARWWKDTKGQIIRSASRRVSNRQAPTLHRLQMAVLALIVADNQHRRKDAERIAASLSSLEPTTPREHLEKLKAALIYHTAFGNLDDALSAGARIVEIERRSGSSANLLRALRWLSSPMRLANNSVGALAVLTEAFQHASRLGLRAEMWNTSYYIQSVALDYEDLKLSLQWAPIFSDLADDATVHALRAFDYAYFMARVEYLRDDLVAAKALLNKSRGLQDTVPRVRGEQSLIALDVLLRTRTDDDIPARTLSRLRALHIKSRDSGTRDFEAAALFQGLSYVGRQREAGELFDYYCSVRRARTEFHSTLRNVQVRLGR